MGEGQAVLDVFNFRFGKHLREAAIVFTVLVLPIVLQHADQAAEVDILGELLLFFRGGQLAAFRLDFLQRLEGVEVAFDLGDLAARADGLSMVVGDAEVALVAQFGGGFAGLFWGFRGG